MTRCAAPETGRRQAGTRPPRLGRRSLAPPFSRTALAIRAERGAEAAVKAAEAAEGKEAGARREVAAAAAAGLRLGGYGGRTCAGQGAAPDRAPLSVLARAPPRAPPGPG